MVPFQGSLSLLGPVAPRNPSRAHGVPRPMFCRIPSSPSPSHHHAASSSTCPTSPQRKCATMESNPTSADMLNTISRLRPSPPTPTFPTHYDASFAVALTQALRLLVDKNELRRSIYRDAANDSRLGHTPPELRDAYQSTAHNQLRSLIDWLEPATPSTPSTTAATPRTSSWSSPATTPETAADRVSSARIDTTTAPLRRSPTPMTRKRRYSLVDEAKATTNLPRKVRKIHGMRTRHDAADSRPCWACLTGGTDR
jgi:hypothetical protein